MSDLVERAAQRLCEMSGEVWREPPFNDLHTDALNNHWRYKARAVLALAVEEAAETAKASIYHSANIPRHTKRLGLKRPATCVDYAVECAAAIRSLSDKEGRY